MEIGTSLTDWCCSSGKVGRVTAEHTDEACGALLEIGEGVVPGLELANLLDRYAGGLARSSSSRWTTEAAQGSADVLIGLTGAAQALRSADRCDAVNAERQLRTAMSLLEGIQQ